VVKQLATQDPTLWVGLINGEGVRYTNEPLSKIYQEIPQREPYLRFPFNSPNFNSPNPIRNPNSNPNPIPNPIPNPNPTIGIRRIEIRRIERTPYLRPSVDVEKLKS